MCLAVNRLAIGVRVYLTGTGLSLMVDAHVMASPSAGGGAPFVIVFVVTNFLKLEADSCSDLSNAKPPLKEILPE